MNAERVVLEITERASLENVENLRTTVARLRERGFRIAIDDLGAGYAGLNNLPLLEPEIVKLDMNLVRDIDTIPIKQKVVGSMTGLCRDMGLLIIAEGVETLAECNTLLELGCDLLQGYLFARPERGLPDARWEALSIGTGESDGFASGTHRVPTGTYAPIVSTKGERAPAPKFRLG
jgi:EAL domain-containing protein (putative c-di-GMP-specific phosphodiesterase class I)